jgi:hypothetical protein
MKQNYFQFRQKYYKQAGEQTVDVPTSATLAEAYIQNMKHKYIYY